MVATTAIYTWVPAPAVTPHPFGLFSVVPPEMPADPHWMLGVRWQSFNCTSASVTEDPCITGAAPGSKNLTGADWCGTIAPSKPFTVYRGHTLSGTSVDVGSAEVRTSFEGSEERAVEEFLWQWLHDDWESTPNGSGDSPEDALAIIESQLGRGYNGTGIIHMGRALASLLSQRLVRVGNHLETVIGTPVVVGAGYDNPPLASSAELNGKLIWGTGAVSVRRGPVEMYDAWDRSVNDLNVLAERTYVVAVDCQATSAIVNIV